MRRPTIGTVSLLAIAISCGPAAEDFRPETIIALERAALDRWGKGDPQGYLETYAPEVTYFDPYQEKRIDTLEAMKQLLAPLTGKIKVDSYEIIDPRIQRHGDVAVLSYRLLSHVRPPDRAAFTVRWNCTEVYARVAGAWKIIHNHWSHTKPDGKPLPAE